MKTKLSSKAHKVTKEYIRFAEVSLMLINLEDGYKLAHIMYQNYLRLDLKVIEVTPKQANLISLIHHLEAYHTAEMDIIKNIQVIKTLVG